MRVSEHVKIEDVLEEEEDHRVESAAETGDEGASADESHRRKGGARKKAKLNGGTDVAESKRSKRAADSHDSHEGKDDAANEYNAKMEEELLAHPRPAGVINIRNIFSKLHPEIKTEWFLVSFVGNGETVVHCPKGKDHDAVAEEYHALISKMPEDKVESYRTIYAECVKEYDAQRADLKNRLATWKEEHAELLVWMKNRDKENRKKKQTSPRASNGQPLVVYENHALATVDNTRIIENFVALRNLERAAIDTLAESGSRISELFTSEFSRMADVRTESAA